MLAQRVMAALIGAPLLLALAYAGGWWFVACIALLATVAWHELTSMLAAREIRPSRALGYAAVLAFVGTARVPSLGLAAGVTVAMVIISLAQVVLSAGRLSFGDAAATVFGATYAGLLFGFVVRLRERGFALVALVLVVTWAADTFAYFAGRSFGKHKLAPRISPKKSVEGAIGGLTGALVVGAIAGRTAGLTPVAGATIGAVAGVISPLGDLAESAIKRWCGVKDSGAILPGHGGVLDRFDSLLFVAPCVYYLLLTLIH